MRQKALKEPKFCGIRLEIFRVRRYNISICAKRKEPSMKKISRVMLTVAVVMAMFVASGCARSGGGAEFDPAQSSIFIKKDGSVLSASVGHSEQNYYSEEELKGFMETELAEFNASQGKEGAAYNQEGAEKLPAAIVSCKVEGADGQKVVKAILEYSSPEMLLALAGENRDGDIKLNSLATDSVENRLAAGELVGSSFVDDKGKAVDAGKITSQSKLRVVSAQGPALIQTEGKVLYMSEGCTLADDYTVQTPEEGSSFIIFK